VRLRSHIRRVPRIVAISLVIAAGTLGGMALALLAATTQQQHTSFGSVETRVRPDLDGRVIVYVPLVDWHVELLHHRAPATIQVILRGVDRSRASKGISSANAAASSLEAMRDDSEQVIRTSVHRAVLVTAIGGVLGGVVAGALLGVVLLRRRWLLVAPLFAMAMTAAVLVPSVRAVDRLGQQHLEVTTAGGNAGELPVVLRFAEQLLHVGNDYTRHYETALDSMSNLAAFAGTKRTPNITSTALVISDLHDNGFVLEPLDAFAKSDTVFAVGDFVQVGAKVEDRLAERVARLGTHVIAVSGNHDTSQYMTSLGRAGATVLDATHTSTFAGMHVAGYPDPLERDPDSRGEHRLRVYGAEYERQVTAFLHWWDGLDQRPDVLLVHQHGFAHRLLLHLAKTGDRAPLHVLTGHDHLAHVHADGAQVIVDGGTIGAGGLAAVGEQPASFARLDLASGRVVAVDVISIEPLTGKATSTRTLLPTPIG
jgi:predicted phosphodiesterase